MVLGVNESARSVMALATYTFEKIWETSCGLPWLDRNKYVSSGDPSKRFNSSSWLPRFLLDYLCSIKYEFPFVWNKPLIPGPRMHHTYSPLVFQDVTMEMSQMLLVWGSLPEHLSCPWEHLESAFCAILSLIAPHLLSSRERTSWLPLPLFPGRLSSP